MFTFSPEEVVETPLLEYPVIPSGPKQPSTSREQLSTSQEQPTTSPTTLQGLDGDSGLPQMFDEHLTPEGQTAQKSDTLESPLAQESYSRARVISPTA